MSDLRTQVAALRTVPNARMGSGERTDYFEGWLDCQRAVMSLIPEGSVLVTPEDLDPLADVIRDELDRLRETS